MRWSKYLLILTLVGCVKSVQHEVPKNTLQSFDNAKPYPNQYDNALNFWAKFQDSTLESLLQQALLHNLDLKIAKANLLKARAIKSETQSLLYPKIDVDGSASRDRLSSHLPFTSFSFSDQKFISNFFSLGFDALWELDLFGTNKTKVKAKKSLVKSSEYLLKDVFLTLFAEVASTYVEIRGLQHQILTNEHSQMILLQLLQLEEDLVNAGLDNEINMQLAKERLLQENSNMQTLKKTLKEITHSLSVLIGKNPTELYETLGGYQKIPDGFLPVEISSPSKVIQTRPDIRALEKRLESLTFEVNASIKELFPNFSIFAKIGRQADTLKHFISAKSLFWGFGFNFFYNLITQKDQRARIRQNKAEREIAILEYQKGVLNAFREVESGLSNYFLERKRFITLSMQTALLEKNETLFNQRFIGGQISYREVLRAKLEILTQKKEQIESKKLVAIYLIALYKAFGGPFDAL